MSTTASEPASGLLTDVLTAAATFFPDLNFVAPGGVLTIREPLSSVAQVRIELPKSESLQLQSVSFESPDTAEVTAGATVRVSSWHKQVGESFDQQRLFDFDNPSGTVIHTGADEPAWLEIEFAHPVDLTEVRLRNTTGIGTARVRGIKVLVASDDGPWLVCYDAGERAEQLEHAGHAMVAHASTPLDVEYQQLLPVLTAAISGDYPTSRKLFEALTTVSDPVKREFKQIVTRRLLADRQLEWTGHGTQRSFRFWSDRERVDYVTYAAKVALELRELTPKTCFGFGAALAVVRDGEPIPHDDDLDLIVGFEREEAPTLPHAMRLIEAFLRPRGYAVTGNFTAHRHVSRAGFFKKVDVFAGLFEGDTIAWYPGVRGSLTRQMMFPTSEGTMLGVTCPLPRNPLLYLEQVYGPSWRVPDPTFAHVWNRSAYLDLVKPPPNAGPSQ